MVYKSIAEKVESPQFEEPKGVSIMCPHIILLEATSLTPCSASPLCALIIQLHNRDNFSDFNEAF